VGDFDDILMFTTRSTGKPFIGTFSPDGGTTLQVVQSDVAEVAWFIRGRTLYRRQLLVAPGIWDNLSASVSALGFYANNDISVHANSASQAIPNTLSDLTRRECRYAHPNATTLFPFDARLWGEYGLPTLRECSASSCSAGTWTLPSSNYPKSQVDFWSNSTDSSGSTTNPLADNALGYSGARVADDVILTNVIGFDVKVWDPGANGGVGGYVDLGNYDTTNNPSPPAFFTGYGIAKSMLQGSVNTARVYDTWSTHYENVGLAGLTYPDQYPAGGFPGRGVNGFDDDGNGIVDDESEKLTSPPYPAPLRGIQVKIRVFEPDSRQIREVTIVQDFLPK